MRNDNKKRTLLFLFFIITMACTSDRSALIPEPEPEPIPENNTEVQFICEFGEIRECDYGLTVGECQNPTQGCFGYAWGACLGAVEPTEEICDGLDNDCNGYADELWMKPELCNGLDDDCDGAIDEGWSKRLACEFEETNPWIVYDDEEPTSACHRGFRLCHEGAITECFEFEGPGPELCDSADNDCDGDIDEDLDYNTECGLSEVGQCTFGHEICYDAEIICFDMTLPRPETCDGLDNNCNGDVDEDLIQACATICEDGTETCSDGNWIDCTAIQPTDEVCDGVDNDCDNIIDEGANCSCLIGVMTPCVSDPCGFGIQTCLEGGVWSECIGVVPQVETCNNHDDDCDGIVDGLTRNCYTGPPVTLGVAQCINGVEECINGHWLSCEDQVLPEDEICDGLDNDCDGMVDNMERTYEKADMVFIIDVSGSMRDVIDALIEGIGLFTSSLRGEEHRFAIVLFGGMDFNEQRLLLQLSGIDMLIDALSDLEVLGGLEPSIDVVFNVASPGNLLNINWRDDATPFILLFTDEVAQSYNSTTVEDLREVLHPCVLPGCNNSTNSDWVDNEPVELFVFTAPEFFSPWSGLVPMYRQHVFNINRLHVNSTLEADLGLVFSELCYEE